MYNCNKNNPVIFRKQYMDNVQHTHSRLAGYYIKYDHRWGLQQSLLGFAHGIYIAHCIGFTSIHTS